MKLKEFDILLDIRKLNNPNIEVVQDDVNANVFNISLVDGLEPFDLSGCDVDLVVSKSDGTTVMQSTSSDPPGVAIVNEKQGKIRCVLKTNTIASPGRTIAEVKISESDVMLTSAQFEFYIRKSLLNDKTIESTNEFPVLKKLVEDTKNIIDAVPIIEEKLNEITSINSNLNQAITTGQSLNTDLSGIITDANTAKDALDTIVTTANNIKDELEDIIAGTDFEQVLYELNNKLDKDGDSKDNTVTFEEAEVDDDIESGETHSTIFGKILKAIKTLRSGKVNKSDIVQTAEVNDTNKIPSSAVTNGLKQDINELNNKLTVQTVDLTTVLTISNPKHTLQYAQAMKYGNLITLTIRVVTNDKFSTTEPPSFTLPIGYRPLIPVRVPCMLHNNPIGNPAFGYTDIGYCVIETGGEFAIRNYTGSTANYALVSVTYIAV